MGIAAILHKTAFLQFVDKRDWIDGGPHPMFRISSSLYELLLSEIVRSAASATENKEIGKQLRSLGKEMMMKASGGLLAGWEEGDDICPPWFGPHPIPHFQDAVFTVPDTAPALSSQVWKGINQTSTFLDDYSGAFKDMILANIVRVSATLTSDPHFSGKLKEIGEQLVANLAGTKNRLYDDYCGTPVKPRHIGLSRT